jgi:hypothetical protein
MASLLTERGHAACGECDGDWRNNLACLVHGSRKMAN